MDNLKNKEEFEIDLLHLAKLLWKKAWIIAISVFLAGAALFSYSVLLITPQYKASAMMYVNNSSFSLGSTSVSISTGQLSAARSLLDTYVVILKTRTTFEKVIEKSGVERTYGELMNMVSASPVDETEVFKITATSSDPAEAELIVKTIVEILPDRISDIVDGSSVRLVDNAVLPTSRSSPNHTRNAIIGMLLGFIVSAGIIILIDVMDSSVRDEEYLTQKYNMPVLAIIPDSSSSKKSSYGKYGKYYKHYGKYYGGYYGGYYGHRPEDASDNRDGGANE